MVGVVRDLLVLKASTRGECLLVPRGIETVGPLLVGTTYDDCLESHSSNSDNIVGVDRNVLPISSSRSKIVVATVSISLVAMVVVFTALAIVAVATDCKGAVEQHQMQRLPSHQQQTQEPYVALQYARPDLVARRYVKPTTLMALLF
ncbi:hypothetical protein V6N13_139955 [Hibiscus sabdariffa]|uniref:Uncharacterized protein n=1 Tax=Hibiscus sabdariffa TaxID=183260 RepID=A0ABR2QBV9_9ROSI